MRSEHAAPRAAKSADRIEGAIMAGGDISTFGELRNSVRSGNFKL